MNPYQSLEVLNPGNGSAAEYEFIGELIKRYAPGNVLVFSVGKDSSLWYSINAGGNTIFLENIRKWIRFSRKLTPEINILKVGYSTRRRDWKKLIDQNDRLQMKLPDYIKNTVWDVVFVDGPRGYNDKVPGRMQSIYSASRLRARHILVHDCDREVEKTYFKHFLGEPTTIIDKLFHREMEMKSSISFP